MLFLKSSKVFNSSLYFLANKYWKLKNATSPNNSAK